MTNFNQTIEYPAIVGIGSYLPADVVSNDELIRRTGMDSSDEAIQRLTQIEHRCFGYDELPSDMGVIAVRRALLSAQIGPEQIVGMYVSTMSKDMVTPDTAVIMHGKLGLPTESLSLDIGAACAGGVVALYEAANRTRAEDAPTLAVGLGKMSPITNFGDRRTGILFGDGSGALVVANASDFNPRFTFFTVPDPEAINIPGETGRPAQDLEENREKIAMKGPAVKDYAATWMPRAAISAAKKAGAYDEQADRIDWDKIAAVVPHQANGNILDDVGKCLQIPPEKLVFTVNHHGNTSAASIPLALDEAYREGRFDPNKRNLLLVTAIGAGMSVGAGVIEFKPREELALSWQHPILPA